MWRRGTSGAETSVSTCEDNLDSTVDHIIKNTLIGSRKCSEMRGIQPCNAGLGCPHGHWAMTAEHVWWSPFYGESNALTLYLISWERGMQNFCLPRWERRLQGTLRDRLAKHRQRLVWPCAAPYAQPPRITKNQLLLFSQQCSLRSHFRRHLSHLSYREKRCCHVTADTRLCAAAWHCATLLEILRAGYEKPSTWVITRFNLAVTRDAAEKMWADTIVLLHSKYHSQEYTGSL